MLLRTNYEGLIHARTKSFDFNHFRIDIQYNPKRIISSGAKVDDASISSRKCFLCFENRPDEQSHVLYEKDYAILCNPYPIFSDHLTIASLEHRPQQIEGEFHRLLHLSRDLPGMVLFYNGPKCGASAPDHMHFQAGNRGLMPLEQDFNNIVHQNGTVLIKKDDLTLTATDDGLRRVLTMESSNESFIDDQFNRILEHTKIYSADQEPMMNLLVYYDKLWRVQVFLRELHRPEQYFLKGEDNILFSPAAVDMGGTLILPLEKDFRKLGKVEIIDMFKQVTINKEKFNDLKEFLKEK